MLEALTDLHYSHIAMGMLSITSPSLLPDIAILVGLLVIFAVAAELITKGTEKLEKLLGQGMAGGVVLGFMSALPETIFVIIAAGSGYSLVALGTAIGGNLLLFTIGIGLIGVAYFAKWRKDVELKEDYHVDLAFLILSTIALMVLLVYGRLDAFSGSILFIIYIIYVLYRYSKAHSRLMGHIRTQAGRSLMLQALLFMLIGIAIIAALSRYFINTLISVAGILAIPAILVAIVMAPIAADLEELISAYKLSRGSRGGGSTAVISFIGAKLENNTVLVGIIGLLASAPVLISSAAPELMAVIAINAIAIAILSRGKLTYMQGITMIALYFVAIAAAVIL